MPRRKVQDNVINETSLVDNSYYELASFYDVLKTSYIYDNYFVDVKINDLLRWLRNPYKNLKYLIKLSKYYYAKNGVVTDAYDLFRVLPILNYSILYDNMQSRNFKSYKKAVDNFIKSINVKKLVRDTIFHVISEGFCVWYNRSNKYIQFLEYDEIRILYNINGKWQVEYDMSNLDKLKTLYDIEQAINMAPDEITMRTYNLYQQNPSEYRFIPLDISKTQVFTLRGSRNSPYGIPYAIPALSSIIHRDLLEKSERALANRIINQVIIQKIGNMPSSDGKAQLPPPKKLIEDYHNNLKNLLQRKFDEEANDNTSVAPLTIPGFIEVDELGVNMTTFPKEIWERIDRDIYQKLGFSPSLNYGGGTGQSFGSSTINVEKIYSIIFYLLEEIEYALNEYLSSLIPVSTFNPTIKFSRQTILDKETAFKQAEALYLKGRGSLKDYVEASGRDFDHWLAQVRYENEVLKLDELLPIHSTSFTQSGDSNSGRPKADIKNKSDNSMISDGNNGNNIPSPSD